MRHAPPPDHAAPALAPAAAPGAVGEAAARPAEAGGAASLTLSQAAQDIRLSKDEIQALTPGLTLPRVQLRHLHQAGFWRARLGVDGTVILERAHYLAVCAGALPADRDGGDTSRPQLQPVRRKAA